MTHALIASCKLLACAATELPGEPSFCQAQGRQNAFLGPLLCPLGSLDSLGPIPAPWDQVQGDSEAAVHLPCPSDA